MVVVALIVVVGFAGTFVVDADGAAFSFFHVSGPTTPSCLRPFFAWNDLTACSVLSPKSPSTVTLKPCAFRAVWLALTPAPESPLCTLSSGFVTTRGATVLALDVRARGVVTVGAAPWSTGSATGTDDDAGLAIVLATTGAGVTAGVTAPIVRAVVPGRETLDVVAAVFEAEDKEHALRPTANTPHTARGAQRAVDMDSP